MLLEYSQIRLRSVLDEVPLSPYGVQLYIGVIELFFRGFDFCLQMDHLFLIE